MEIALENYLEKENLEGDNQYFCDMCQSKQDASVYTTLNKLPEVWDCVLSVLCTMYC